MRRRLRGLPVRRSRGAAGNVTPIVLGPLLWVMVAGLATCTSCTEAGCGSGMTFHVTSELKEGQPYLVEACVNEMCRSGTLEVAEDREPAALPVTEVGGLGLDTGANTIYLTLPADRDWNGTHATTLTVRTADGRLLIGEDGESTMTRIQPNGPNCEPTCWIGEVSA